MTSIQGIIFDFNGTLVWDTELHQTAWKEMATRMLGHELSNEQLHTNVIGRINKEIFEYLLGRSVSDEECRQLAIQKETIYQKLALAQGEQYCFSPGAEQLLDQLKRKSVPITIATSSDKFNVDFFIEYFKLGTWFTVDKIVYDDGSYPGKPAPNIFLRAAQQIGLQPDQCAVIEDSASGLRAAHQAGIGKIIALGPGSRHEQLLEIPGVEQTVESLVELSCDELVAP